ncbi:MAG: hypothetical protein QXS17_03005 [Candidatus Micrarchaeaceae archaeon]
MSEKQKVKKPEPWEENKAESQDRLTISQKLSEDLGMEYVYDPENKYFRFFNDNKQIIAISNKPATAESFCGIFVFDQKYIEKVKNFLDKNWSNYSQGSDLFLLYDEGRKNIEKEAGKENINAKKVTQNTDLSNIDVSNVDVYKRVIMFLSRHSDASEPEKVEKIARKIIESTGHSVIIAFEGYSDSDTRKLFNNLYKFDYRFLASKSPFPEWYLGMLRVLTGLEEQYGKRVTVEPIDMPDTVNLANLPPQEADGIRNKIMKDNVNNILDHIDEKSTLLIVVGAMHGLYMNDFMRGERKLGNNDIELVNIDPQALGLYEVYRATRIKDNGV